MPLVNDLTDSSEGDSLRTFSAFQEPAFRRLWLNTLSFSLANGIQRFVFVWLVLELSDNSYLLGAVSFAMGVPILFFSLPAGVIADRFDRRQMIVVSQLGALSISVLAALMSWVDLMSPGMAMVFAFALGTTTAFGQPARQAIVPTIVDPRRLMNAITLSSFGQNLSQLVGPALGGLSIALAGVGGSFALQAVFLAFGLLALVNFRAPLPAASRHRNVRAELAEGISFVTRTANVRVLIILLLVSALITAGPWSTLLPKIAKDELGQGAFGASILFTSMGVGTLLSALVLASMKELKNAGGWFIVTVIIGSSIMVGLGLSKVYGLTLGLMFVSGLNTAFFMNLNLTLIQAYTPQPVMGRVMSIYTLCFMGGMPIGAMLAGVGAGLVGAPAYFAGCGITMVVIASAAILTQPSMRRMTTAGPGHPPPSAPAPVADTQPVTVPARSG